MKILYLECNMGASGDMLLSALYELLPDKNKFLEAMNSLIPGISIMAEKAVTCGITGSRTEVSINGKMEKSIDLPLGSANIHKHQHKHEHENEHEHQHGHEHKHGHEHHHNSLANIRELISGFSLPDVVKSNACAVYDSIAEAESNIHGVPVTQIHFHEVGTLDAVIDVTGVCLAMYILSPDSIMVSPVHLGSGQVHCAHGILPVPTPATAYLLRGLPCYNGEIQGELCTPTGAALLKYFGQSFGSMPVMTTRSIGYGVGEKTFPAANCVRAFLGEKAGKSGAEIIELCCHIDDMTAESLAFASEQLMSLGALDVSSAPITMKKGRAGIALTVLCRIDDEERMAKAILRETNTNGIRARKCRKYMLHPTVKTVETRYGTVKVKCADGYDIHHMKPEYECIASIARERKLPFQSVWEDVLMQIKESSNSF